MSYALTRLSGLILTVATVLACAALPIRAAETPFAGTWKVNVLSAGNEITVWLVKLEGMGDKLQASVVATGLPGFDGTVDNARADAGSVHMTIKSSRGDFEVTGYAPKGEATPKKLRGSIEVRGQHDLVQLERTDLKELDPGKVRVPGPAADAYLKAMRIKEPESKETALKEILEKFGDQPLAYPVGLNLLQLRVKTGDEAEVRKAAEGAIKVAAEYGPEMKLQATYNVARTLAGQEKLAALALDFANRAEKQLRASDPASTQVPILKTLVAALTKSGKKAEASAIKARIAKLDEILDREFIKDAVPFKTEAFAGRKGKSDRRVLVELFTGAQCPPCVSADVAFDAMLKAYQPADVILLQYHLHIPGPDPLTNTDSEARSKYYDVNSTPTLFINGAKGPAMGGYKQHGEERYQTLTKALEEPLKAEAAASVKLAANRKGDKIAIRAEATGIKDKEADVRLLLVLIEDVVRYAGSNGQRLHHHVVRAFPGGVEGVAVKNGAAKQDVDVALADVGKTLKEYLADANKKRPFLDDDRPLDLRHLKVVAFLQDQKTKEVLNAVEVAVPSTE
jgi:hypothetical protein